MQHFKGWHSLLMVIFIVSALISGSAFRIQLGNQSEVDPEDINVTFNDVKGVSSFTKYSNAYWNIWEILIKFSGEWRAVNKRQDVLLPIQNKRSHTIFQERVSQYLLYNKTLWRHLNEQHKLHTYHIYLYSSTILYNNNKNLIVAQILHIM